MNAYSEQDIDLIAKLLSDRQTADQIAKILSAVKGCTITRNSIIGKVLRHKRLNAIGLYRKPGWQQREKQKLSKIPVVLAAPKAKAKPGPKPVKRVHAPRVASAIRAAQDHQPVIARSMAFEPLPGTTPVPFGSPGCKWSVDTLSGRGMLWCGGARDTSRRDSEPYCKAHARLAYSPRAA